MRSRQVSLLAVLAALALLVGACGREEGEGGGGGGGGSDPGITETSIKIGGSYPFSGPASAYRSIRDGANAYFEYVNSKGGVGGRKIEFITYDDAYEPARAVTNARRLIEQDQVFALFNTLGTPNNLAMWDYVNQQEVPHLFVATGGSYWGADISKHPWTTGWQPTYPTEAKIYAEFLKQEEPDATVAVLFQNDAFGEDLLGAFEKGIEGSDLKIVAKESYEVTDPTAAPQVQKLAASDADVFLDITTPKFGAQAIATVAKTDWKPLHILNNVSASKQLVLTPVGLENAEGIISTAYFKDPEDPQWEDDAAMMEYKDGIKQFAPRADPNEPFNTYGWAAASTMVKALEGMQEPTRESLMESVRSMDTEIPILLPGIKVQMNGADDTYPIEAMQIQRFNGKNWELQGEVVEAAVEEAVAK
jgi:branched-chain amino acid transport system substrate-binding protein